MNMKIDIARPIRPSAVFLGFIFALVLVTFGFSSAQAHSELEASTPAAGSSVSHLEQFTLTFDAALVPEFSKYTLVSSSGTLVKLGTPTYDVTKTVVTVPVTGELSSGKYLIGFAILSVDGHPVAGEVAFTSTAVGPTPTPTPTPSPAPKPAVDTSGAVKVAFAIVGLGVPVIIVAIVLFRRRRVKP